MSLFAQRAASELHSQNSLLLMQWKKRLPLPFHSLISSQLNILFFQVIFSILSFLHDWELLTSYFANCMFANVNIFPKKTQTHYAFTSRGQIGGEIKMWFPNAPVEQTVTVLPKKNLFALVTPCSLAETCWPAINHVFQGNFFPRVCAIFELAPLSVQSPWHCANIYLNHLPWPCQCTPQYFPLHH